VNQTSKTSEQEIIDALPEAECKETELENKIAELNSGLAAANDKYLRLSAEFDNFRKRTLKEKMDLVKNASESVMVNFLPVIDDVERAMQAIKVSHNLETTKEGINLIYNKFKDFTKQNGVVEMEAKGMVLNTDLHEAITKIPAPTEELKGKIVEVVQKGYLLNDKVIRFAKVVIGE
jgi:molecular chaperone GrpE